MDAENAWKLEEARPAQAKSGKKLSKAERREQLLETAMTVVRTKGADALTLAHVASVQGSASRWPTSISAPAPDY